jgi:hypothetical protein
MKAQTHTLRNKMDTEGMREFFTPLMEHAAEPAVKRVENVLTLLVSADTLAREQREKVRFYERSGKDWRQEDGKSFSESLDASTHTCNLLNLALQRYRWVPMVWSQVGRLEAKQRAVTVSAGKWAPWERWAAGMLFTLANRPGELSRFRRCLECSQWFYAVRGHQQFCGESCRRRHAAQDPTFKEKRAAYMRETYRPLQKELDANNLAAVKGKP